MSKKPTTRSRRTRGLLASVAAVALGFTGLVALATSASAHHGVVAGTASCADPNGGFTIDWTVTAVGPAEKALTLWWDNGTTSGLDIVGGGSSPVNYSMANNNLFTGTYGGNAVLNATTTHNVSQVGTGVTLDGLLIWNNGGQGEVESSVSLFVAEPAPCPPVEEEPELVEITPPAETKATCTELGSVSVEDTDGYYWLAPVFDGNVVTLTAVARDGYEFYGEAQTEWTFDLNKLTDPERCPTPIDETPPLEEDPPVVIQTLAQTGFPLLGVLGLAGAFSLIGGGLLNAGRILRNRH